MPVAFYRAYGPNATTQGPAFGEVKKEAVEGVRYALQALPAGAQPMRVLIPEIHRYAGRHQRG
ncbi:hypothetical protein FHU36_006774 [Nonomuraea muscovyensis]|uniref:Uncharacterized protein n=1 Tax=Nonomuraea muscovyensis TaxID=1124761 RepID=A0A7X0C7Y9_9ACTN|nr:hypothetical protein [Nonomuraea muscovyensis]